MRGYETSVAIEGYRGWRSEVFPRNRGIDPHEHWDEPEDYDRDRAITWRIGQQWMNLLELIDNSRVYLGIFEDARRGQAWFDVTCLADLGSGSPGQVIALCQAWLDCVGRPPCPDCGAEIREVWDYKISWNYQEIKLTRQANCPACSWEAGA